MGSGTTDSNPSEPGVSARRNAGIGTETSGGLATIPLVLCGLAVLGWICLQLWFQPGPGPGIGEGTGADGVVLAGPERIDTGADVEAESEQLLELERASTDEVPGGIEASERDDRDGLWVNPRSSGLAWSSLGAVDGLLTFRGNPTRTFYGQGPVPEDPEVLWQQTIGCSNSNVGGQAKQWCGSGWTGQPAVFQAPLTEEGSDAERPWWVGVGGYNGQVNFFDPATGDTTYPSFRTGDIIKGSITVDPDGFPLMYTGSRDNFFHVVAIDQAEPRELWRLSADDAEQTLWNNDWDSSALVIDDYLFVGGENSRFYVVKLNRGFDRSGAVTVDPVVVFSGAGWDQELLSAIGDSQVSIENSVAISGNTVYFTNSGGLVQGWDMSGLAADGANGGDDAGSPDRVFRYWTGDDTDASVVIDGDGMLYVASEYERGNQRARALGQVFKLDPSKPRDPLVWSVDAASQLGGGVWATPALYEDLLIVPTDDGRVLGLDRYDGVTRWSFSLPGPLWSSPVVVDDTLIQADCSGVLHAFDLAGSADGSGGRPNRLWQVSLGGCIESTPAVWDGRIFVGTRGGDFFAVGDRGLAATGS